ncbi:hypothetical protein LCGC14_2032170, partial [marine sediment metagenome]
WLDSKGHPDPNRVADARLCQEYWQPSELRDTPSKREGKRKTDRERIKQIRTVQKRQAAAQDSPNGITFTYVGEYVRVTFAEKPERETLNTLKAAGFWWGGGCWSGKTVDLPQAVKEMA